LQHQTLLVGSAVLNRINIMKNAPPNRNKELEMKMTLLSLLSLVALLTASSYANADSHTSYTREVQLKDGKRLTCVVNGPASQDSSLASIETTHLSAAERNEAEVMATAPLRLRYHGDKNSYPDPKTAPRVSCSSPG
jgi:hypothetical protein